MGTEEMMMSQPTCISEYFNQPIDIGSTIYCTIGARPISVGTVGLDSSDQAVFIFDTVSGITAYRSGLNLADASNTVTHYAVDDIRTVVALPALTGVAGLRLKLGLEHLRRFRTGHRLYFSSLQKPSSFMHPRLVAALEREVTDYRYTVTFLNSLYNRPGLIFMRDGRLNAQKFPGPVAYDHVYRLMAARGIRAIGVAKTAQLLEVIRPYARSIRQRVGDRPFVVPILREHLDKAHPGPNSAFLKTLRHGASNQAYGGAGAVRFALSISGEELCLIEFNLYDLELFNPLVYSGQTLEQWARQTFGSRKWTVYSWNILKFVSDQDWERLFIPTLEEIVCSAYAGGELGLYPRALGDIHNRVKLRWLDLEATRRRLMVELGWEHIRPEMIPIHLEDPHKFDPDVVNYKFE